MLTTAVVVAVAAAFVLARSVVIVPGGQAWVVERLGRYARTLHAGLHVILPFADRVAHRFPLQATEREVSEVCITKDKVPVELTSRVRMRILDPERAAYAVGDREAFLAEVVKSAARTWIGERSEGEVRESTRQLEADVARAASGAAEGAGLLLADVSVQRIERRA